MTTNGVDPDQVALSRGRRRSSFKSLLGNSFADDSPLFGNVGALLTAFGHPEQARHPESAAETLLHALRHATPSEMWLTIAVLGGELPEYAAVQQFYRTVQLNGPITALRDLLRSATNSTEGVQCVDVLIGETLVDVHHTSMNLFSTGIQRVARQVARRWARDNDLVFVGWSRDYRALRLLDVDEIQIVIKDPDSIEELSSEIRPTELRRQGKVVVPWNCNLLIPELPAEPPRARRYKALFEYSGCNTGLIGYDCVPLTAAETTADGMPAAFATFLSAAAHVDKIAAISMSTATEYIGWKRMLTGAGLIGPDIRPIPLAVEAPSPTDADLQEARSLLGIGSLPIVLCIGSHEPRKNHIAVLSAAEEVWRDGLTFTLSFVGGNSWRSDQFMDLLHRLQDDNRPVSVVRSLPDRLLWAAYRIAHCTVFPSLHEGFGLPVAESLASGTPVITSDFGSMTEIAAHGGALLVDPHDDAAISNAIRDLLTNETIRERLLSEMGNIPTRSWDQFGVDTWDYFIAGSEVAS